MDSDIEKIVRDFQKHRQPLLSYIRALTCDSDMAEDIIQDVSVIVLRKANAGERPDNLLAWCRGIARNVLLKERRDNQRLIFFDSEEWIALVDKAFEENQSQAEDHQRSHLRQCMGKLGAEARKVLDLRYTQSLTLKQIAARLERTELAVQVQLSRMRKSLKQCIERNGSATESPG